MRTFTGQTCQFNPEVAVGGPIQTLCPIHVAQKPRFRRRGNKALTELPGFGTKSGRPPPHFATEIGNLTGSDATFATDSVRM
jgi:hypothetical protein